MKRIEKLTVTCAECSTQFEVYPDRAARSKKLFCKRVCANLWQSKNKIGENNNNYGKKWSDELRLQQSIRATKQMKDSAKRYMCGSNRGKKFSIESCKKMSESRMGKPGISHTDEAKKKIGLKSKEKFNDPNYPWEQIIAKSRKTKEEKGTCIPLIQKSDFEIYKFDAHWKKLMWNFSSPEETLLLREIGIWHKSKNKNGATRDHKYSKMQGFLDCVFPEILRHPANLEIMSQKENSSKRAACSISRDQLFDNILTFSRIWDEHEKVLLLIEDYKNGSRWQNINKKETIYAN